MPLLPDIGQITLIARNIATVARYWANNLFLGVLLPDIGQITLFFMNIALLLNKFFSFSFSFFLLVARYWASYTVSTVGILPLLPDIGPITLFFEEY